MLDNPELSGVSVSPHTGFAQVLSAYRDYSKAIVLRVLSELLFGTFFSKLAFAVGNYRFGNLVCSFSLHLVDLPPVATAERW